MSFTYIITTDIGRVRFRIRDKNPSNYLFDDEEIAEALVMEGTVKQACALCLETIATNEALIQKVMKTLNLSTDGAKLADSLMKQAKELRDQAAIEGADSTGLFDWAEHVFDSFSEDERLEKQFQRS